MTDFTKLKIGSRVLYASKYRNKSSLKTDMKECEVIDILKAFKIPKKKKIIKYYGEKIISPKYKCVFGPHEYDRVVLKRINSEFDNDYIVLPLTPRMFNYCNIELL